MFADTLLNDPVRQLKNNNIQTAIKALLYVLLGRNANRGGKEAVEKAATKTMKSE